MAHALLMPGSPLLEAAMHMLMESPMFMSGGNSSFNSYGSAHEHSGYQCGASSEAFRPTHFLLKNDIFGAGVGLMLVSAIYQWIMKRWPTYVDLLWEKRSATLSSDNEVYTYVAEYLADKAHLITNKLDPLDAMMFSCGKALFTLLTPWSWVIWRPKKKRFIIHDRVRTSVCIATYRDDGTSELDDQEQKPSLVFVPDDGSYTLMFEGVALDITVFQSESASVEGRSSRAESARRSGRYGGGEQPVGGKKKSFQITCEGSDSTCIKRFIQMAMDHYFDKHSGKIPIYTLDEGFYPEWRKSALRSPRALDTIVLRDGMLEDIIKDIRSFMSAERWYMEHGIPYRRGHILYGPPGTGKTSTIFAIASYFKMSVCLMNLSSSGMTDSTLQFLLTTAPKNSFIVFEDVDVAFPKSRLENDDEDTQGQSTVTVSGMLNAIDGIAAQEGRIIFLTTNAIESLPPALLRPGRCDRRFLFDHADATMIRSMFLRFFSFYASDRRNELADEIAKKIPASDGISTAQLQGLFLQHRENPESIIDHVDVFLEDVKAQRMEQEKEEERKRKKELEKRKKAKKENEVEVTEEVKGVEVEQSETA